MAKAAYWDLTDAEARKCGEQTGLDTLVVHTVNDDTRCGRSDPFCAAANAISIHLGSTTARLKLKGIDGDPHKQWSMWFNSKQREEPYQDLTSLNEVEIH